MGKEHGTNDNYDPSGDEEFMRIIESVLKEEEAEKINIRQKNEFEWIDIDKEVAASKDRDDFSVYEEVVHKIGDTEELYQTMEKAEEERKIKDKKMVEEITESLSEQVNEQFHEESAEPQKKSRTAFKILIPLFSVIAFLFLTALFLRYTKTGQKILFKISAGYIADNVTYDDGSQVVIADDIPDITDTPDILDALPQKDDIVLTDDSSLIRHEDYAFNLLLLGEEAIGSGSQRGRTDVMMIATINTKDKTIGLTSLMRDMYVQIPGHLDNKLNTAYTTGGVPLLYETIELNFNLKLDGYALVGFNNFEKIIDLLSGVEISLTQNEADYLNTTNYISNPNYRNVKAGVNNFNGNQALGYCRIRYVKTKDKEADDYGRTSRQRELLNALFEKYKSLGIFDMAIKVNSCLSMVQTDLDASEIEDILSKAYEVGLNQIETLRIPADGTFEEVNVRNMSVIVPDLMKNIELMQNFIFGE